MVVAHEVFGHGARFRELGEGRLRYGFDAPDSLWLGRRVYEIQRPFPISPLADLNVSAAGIDAQHALADAIAERAVARGRLHYREAWLYFESRHGRGQLHPQRVADSSEGHDVANFLETFEKACIAPCSPLTRNHVQRRALLALVDPLLYYSMYGLAVSYIGNGRPDRPDAADSGWRRNTRDAVARVRARAVWGGVDVPDVPFHQEQSPESQSRRITGVTLRVGNTGASSTWGLSARAADVLRVRGLRIALAVELWRQPELLADHTSDAQHAGGGAVARLWCRFRECCDRGGRTVFTSLPVTSRRASCRANSSRAEPSFARGLQCRRDERARPRISQCQRQER